MNPPSANGPATTISIGVVLLNWNAAADTLACVRRLLLWQRVHLHIIIVDNASRPEDLAQLVSLEAVPTAPHHITLIRNRDNQGFAGGSNRGLELLLDGDLPVLLLNNDATVDEAALLTLIDALASHPNLGMIGPLLYSPHGTLIAAGSKDILWHIHTLDPALVSPTPPLKPVSYISGSVALIRAKALHEVGLLDENFFFNTEIADWCARARHNNWQTAIHLDARAVHDLHRSSALRSTLYTYYVIRNRAYYVTKHGQLWKWPLLLFWSLYNVALAAKLRLAKHPAQAKAVWLGALDALRGNLGGQNTRILAACATAQSATTP